MERYYLVEKVKDLYSSFRHNFNIIKQSKSKLELMSSKAIKPEEIGVKLNKKGEISCADKNYKIKKISKKEANEWLKGMEKCVSTRDHDYSYSSLGMSSRF